MLAFDPTNQKD
jgi:hypothetical protein